MHSGLLLDVPSLACVIPHACPCTRLCPFPPPASCQVARITATEPQLQQRLKEGLAPASLLSTSTSAARKAAEVVIGPGTGAGQQPQQQQEGLPAAGGRRRGKGKDVLFSDEVR
jgi:hypothetical protein